MARLLVLVLLVVVTGCGGGEPPPASPPAPASTPIPSFVGPADDGAVFRLPVGGTSTLRIRGEGDEPVVTGTAVLLVPVISVAPVAAREWEIRAVEAGTSTVQGRRPRFAFRVVVE